MKLRYFPMTWRSSVGLVLIIWLVILVYMTTVLQKGSENNYPEIMISSYKKQINERDEVITHLQLEVSKLISKMKLNAARNADTDRPPSTKLVELAAAADTKSDKLKRVERSADARNHSKQLRRVGYQMREMWYYLSNQMQGDKLKNIEDRHNMLTSEFEALKSSLGAGREESQTLKRLSDRIQKSFLALQNPSKCSSAKIVECNLNKMCGYGCQLHHIIYCFIMAYGSGRTMVLRGNEWQYSGKGWTGTFQPISSTCTTLPKGQKHEWSLQNQDKQIMHLPLIDFLNYIPEYVPLAVPKSYYKGILHNAIKCIEIVNTILHIKELQHVHGDPYVWFVGQILKYMLKPNNQTAVLLTNIEKLFKDKHPIVGVHVRRTDKVGSEAAFHHIEEYMKHVEHYFSSLDVIRGHKVVRRIYLATDASTLIKDTRTAYPDYEVIGDPSISMSAQLGTRYSDSSLTGIISDVHLLSKTDYLVCTFSSQVCRVAYEIMQQNHKDMAFRFHSLDDFYYFGGQTGHDYVVRREHSDVMKVGDLMGVAGNHWDGNMMAMNKATKKKMVYPAYKMENIVKVAEFKGEKN